MAKKLKDKWLGARADADLEAAVTAYIEAADMSMGDLIRKSVREFMHNHPVKKHDNPLAPLAGQEQ